jgi:hypothetical protein
VDNRILLSYYPFEITLFTIVKYEFGIFESPDLLREGQTFTITGKGGEESSGILGI